MKESAATLAMKDIGHYLIHELGLSITSGDTYIVRPTHLFTKRNRLLNKKLGLKRKSRKS